MYIGRINERFRAGPNRGNISRIFFDLNACDEIAIIVWPWNKKKKKNRVYIDGEREVGLCTNTFSRPVSARAMYIILHELCTN